MLFVPWGWDQPDNAARVQRHGAALTIAKDKYSSETAAPALDRLWKDSQFAARALDAASCIRQEPGVTGAADELEKLLAIDPR
jgi:rhamnosyltransferase subunit B